MTSLSRTGALDDGNVKDEGRTMVDMAKEEERDKELERLLLEGLEGENAKGSVKALFGKLHARVDQLEARQKRASELARSQTHR